ncbi:MAG: PAS domain S-box protein, partial [Bryobacteraceae bacterium]
MSDIHEAAWRQIDTTIYIVETSGDPLAGRVELVSGGAFRLLGYEPQRFIEDRELWHRIMHPDDVAGVVAQTQEVFRLREPRNRIYRLLHALTGEYHWIEDSTVPLSNDQGDLIGIAGVARDITVLKQTEHELRRREHQLEGLIDAMPDGVLVADDTGLILQCNAGVERILGWTFEELRGRAVEILLPERFRTEHMKLRSGYATAPSVRRMGTYELTALHKDGTEVPVDIMLGPAAALGP